MLNTTRKPRAFNLFNLYGFFEMTVERYFIGNVEVSVKTYVKALTFNVEEARRRERALYKQLDRILYMQARARERMEGALVFFCSNPSGPNWVRERFVSAT